MAEPAGESGVARALNAAWLRPPGAIPAIYDVPLPRPRSLDAMADPLFTDLVQRIRKHFFTRGSLD